MTANVDIPPDDEETVLSLWRFHAVTHDETLVTMVVARKLEDAIEEWRERNPGVDPTKIVLLAGKGHIERDLLMAYGVA